MIQLIVYLPKRPLLGAKSSRMQYRVRLDNEKLVTLKVVAAKLKINYHTLAKAVRVAEPPFHVGTHTDKFLRLLSEVKAKTGTRPGRPSSPPCPHCGGTGRVAHVQDQT